MNLHRKPIGGFIRALLRKRNQGQFNWSQRGRWEMVGEGARRKGERRGGKTAFHLCLFYSSPSSWGNQRWRRRGRGIEMCRKNRIILLRMSLCLLPFSPSCTANLNPVVPMAGIRSCLRRGVVMSDRSRPGRYFSDVLGIWVDSKYGYLYS